MSTSTTSLRAAVEKAAADLASSPCTFWACEGPDVPYVAMATCTICATVQDLRAALAEDQQRTT